MKKVSRAILKIEKLVASALLMTIAVLVFWSALARTVGKPINWAQDLSLLAFAWLTFIGADVIIRDGNLISIDMLYDKFPKALKSILSFIFSILMILFLLILVVYGFMLVNTSWNRVFNTLPISYAWCTLAVPVGATLMLTSTIESTIKKFRRKNVG